MKKICTTLLLTTAICVFGCWFTQENYDRAYVAGVQYFVTHFNDSDTIQSAIYYNNQTVNLPLTVWFKVTPRQMDGTYYDIRVAKLYYKVVPGNTEAAAEQATWKLAYTINKGDNPKWRLDFKSPVKLFGDYCITYELIRKNGDTINAGDAIILAWYIVDNSEACIANMPQITPGSTSPHIWPLNTEDYQTESSYKPAYIMKVIYNGINKKVGR